MMSITSHPSSRLFAVFALSSALAACGSAPRSVQSLPPTEYAALKKTADSVTEESAKLAAHQDDMRARLEHVQAQALALAPQAPRYDPLEDKVVTVNMYDASVGQLLWALADQLQMNLVVDPAVLEQQQRASLYLKRVSAREVFERILSTFDLHGSASGRILNVSLMQERMFSVDMLGGKTALNVDTGGDVFGGAGGGSGGNSLRGNLILNGNIGDKNDPYEQLTKSIEDILAQDPQANQSGRKEEKARFSLDRATGSLFVRARPSKISTIAELIQRNKTVMQRQVLVEAQIIDVELKDSFEFGVDWTLLNSKITGRYGPGAITADPLSLVQGSQGLSPRSLLIPGQTVGSATGIGGGLGFTNNTFAVALNALRTFGTVKVLSNPTVRVRNGTPAYLSVGSNIRYVTKLTTSTSNIGGGSSNTASDVSTDALFSGVVVGVAPFIQANGQVELFIHPMQTQVQPQSLNLVDVGNGNKVTLPVVNTKGITTTLNMQSGDTVLIGGLIDQQFANNNSGLPGLSDIPLAGKLLDNQNDSHNSRELIVVLRVHAL